MIQLQNKRVRVIFKNGMSVDGIVQEWSDGLSILQNEENDNLLLIYETSTNVMMVQVIATEIKKENKIVDELHPELEQGASDYINNQANELHMRQIPDPNPKELELEGYEPDPTLRAQKLAELRKLQLQEHKKQLGQHIKAWKAGGVAQTKYSYPSKL